MGNVIAVNTNWISVELLAIFIKYVIYDPMFYSNFSVLLKSSVPTFNFSVKFWNTLCIILMTKSN